MKTRPSSFKKIGHIYIVLLLVMIVIIITMIYNLIGNIQINKKISPLIQATKEIQIQTALSHLWFEELLSGDTTISFDEIIKYQELALWYTNSVLEGGENDVLTIFPIQDSFLRKEVILVQEILIKYKKQTFSRWKTKDISGIGSENDQKYDRIFDLFYSRAKSVEKSIQTYINRKQNNLYRNEIILIILSFLLFVATILIIRKYVKLQLKDEQALKESENKFKGLFEGMSSAVVFCKAIYDKNGEMIDCIYNDMNPIYEKFTSLKKETAIGNKVSVMLPETEPEWFSTFGKVVKTGNPIFFEMFHKTSNIFYSVFAYCSAKDEFTAIFDDITIERKAEKDLKNSEIELRELNATKDKFFSIIAHDLRSPFNSMLGLSKMLLKNFDKYDNSRKKKFFDAIHDSIDNTYNLLENLLVWSRAQRGGIDFSPEKINLSVLSTDIMKLLGQSFENKNITIGVEMSDNIYVEADKNMLQTIIRNLTFNAIKFTPKDGKIILKANISNQNNQGYVKITVEDNGIGISKEIQSKLFNISENISTEGTDNEKGTGLGLIMCCEFVKKHGGNIWVESEPDIGSKFNFTIPISKSN